jgi:hypothetical protein
VGAKRGMQPVIGERRRMQFRHQVANLRCGGFQQFLRGIQTGADGTERAL